MGQPASRQVLLQLNTLCFRYCANDYIRRAADGGIDVGHSAELRKIEKEQGIEARKTRYLELETLYRRLMNPVRTANAFSVEEIIDPAHTRKLVSEWCKMMYDVEIPERVVQRISGKLQPTFA